MRYMKQASEFCLQIYFKRFFYGKWEKSPPTVGNTEDILEIFQLIEMQQRIPKLVY